MMDARLFVGRDSLDRTVDDHLGLSDGVSALRGASGTTGGR